jgi:hypothetical protein
MRRRATQVKDTRAIAETMGEAAAQNSDESQSELLAQGHHLLVIGFDELAAKLSMLPVDEVTDGAYTPARVLARIEHSHGGAG